MGLLGPRGFTHSIWMLEIVQSRGNNGDQRKFVSDLAQMALK